MFGNLGRYGDQGVMLDALKNFDKVRVEKVQVCV